MIGTYDKETLTADFSWNEIKSAWMQMHKGNLNLTHNAYKIPDQWSNSSWLGFTVEEANDWLVKGYKVPGMKEDIGFTPIRQKRRIRNSAEGDLDYGAFLTGAENPFSAKTKVKAKPGIDLECVIVFSASCKASIIEKYLLWMNKVAYSIESQGSDVAIRIVSPVKNLYRDGIPAITTRITVKKAGEWLDPESWSPILSPAGYRGFGFMATILTAELLGQKVAGGLGRPVNEKWDVTFNAGILRVECPMMPSDFPEETMTAKVLDLIGNR